MTGGAAGSGAAARVAGAAVGAASTSRPGVAGALEDSPEPPALRSRERFRRCSGISVTDQSFRGTRTGSQRLPRD
ncbi:MAG: hypothetical protein FGM29_04545 [Actinobacteria bacterium]|nr:hypothetical protein [Actinomycetota bacterium]